MYNSIFFSDSDLVAMMYYFGAEDKSFDRTILLHSAKQGGNGLLCLYGNYAVGSNGIAS